MRKIITLIILAGIVAAAVSTSLFAQNRKKSSQAAVTDAVTMLNRTQVLLQKAYYPLGTVKSTRYQAILVTDITDGGTTGCVSVETNFRSTDINRTYTASIEYDELDLCINSLAYIRDKILDTKPNSYVEYSYTTREGVTFGTFYDLNKTNWISYVQTDELARSSIDYLNDSDIEKLIAALTNGKALIKPQLKFLRE